MIDVHIQNSICASGCGAGLKVLGMDQGILNIINLAIKTMNAQAACVTILEHPEMRTFSSQCEGVANRLEDATLTQLQYYLGGLVLSGASVIVIPDMFVDAMTRDHPHVRASGFRSYIGVPIHRTSGEVVGALCCLALHPEPWTAAQVEILGRLAFCLDAVIAARVHRMQEVKARDKLLKLNTARGGFLAHLSQEIRTPLTAINGSIDLMRTFGLGKGDNAALLDLLASSTARLMNVVNDFLVLAELDAGLFTFAEETFDLSDIGRSVVEAYRELADSKGLTLEFNDQLHGRLYMSDRRVIDSILRTLFENAVRFTDAGHARIDLLENRYGHVVIRVSDTGKGIPEDLQSTIFDEFELAGPGSARTYGGTGLGMAIVKRLVGQLGGEISLDSHVGEGTTFSLVLPLRPHVNADLPPDDGLPAMRDGLDNPPVRPAAQQSPQTS